MSLRMTSSLLIVCRCPRDYVDRDPRGQLRELLFEVGEELPTGLRFGDANRGLQQKQRMPPIPTHEGPLLELDLVADRRRELLQELETGCAETQRIGPDQSLREHLSGTDELAKAIAKGLVDPVAIQPRIDRAQVRRAGELGRAHQHRVQASPDRFRRDPGIDPRDQGRTQRGLEGPDGGQELGKTAVLGVDPEGHEDLVGEIRVLQKIHALADVAVGREHHRDVFANRNGEENDHPEKSRDEGGPEHDRPVAHARLERARKEVVNHRCRCPTPRARSRY